ncbi:hypothetical protein [Pseudoxanthomonas mexicana]|uniref:hypothetical protein n=1 Tax=Pseudoxanthomonas mexicana TaxID=128785 RepID=UPI0020A08535|nr:hypothetical protein [Pseudoxanthomonas mexicana]MCP1582589.1 hypothetical protein [Pseudoxanthomonas mexicana]
MVVIRQHGNNSKLFDISSFLADVDRFAPPDTWHITIDECLGDRALEIEQLTASGLSMSDGEFQALYRGIYQTIDGHFLGLAGGERVFELLAVDSSFWEVTGSPAFESHMLTTYGAWQRA